MGHFVCWSMSHAISGDLSDILGVVRKLLLHMFRILYFSHGCTSLTHLSRMKFTTLINWASPLPILGLLVGIFLIIPPANFVCGGYTVFMLSIRAIIGHTRADQLLPQLLMEQFDTLLIQCRHIEHMYEGVWFRKNNF